MSGTVAEQVLAASPADDTIVLVNASSIRNVRWAGNELTTNGDARTGEVTCIAVQHSRDGARTASVTRPVADLDAARLAAEAWDRARSSEPAWDAAPLVPGRAEGDWGGDAPWTSIDELTGPVARLGEAFAEDADAGREHFGYAEAAVTSTWLASSTGLRLRYDQPAAWLELTLKSHDRTRSTWAGHAGPSLAAAGIPGLVEQARRELGWQARELPWKPGRYPALLTPSATADFMIDLLWGAEARAAAEGRSVFADAHGTRLGQRLAQRPVTLFSDPELPSQQCAPFLEVGSSGDWASVFDNGLPVPRTEWIADGVLSALVSSRAVAEKYPVPLAPAPGNLALDAGGSGDLADVITRTQEAVLITCTWYNRMVDPQQHLITGLTRDGVYLVRDGEVAGRLPNFRFNDSPVAMLDRITDAGAAVPALAREMGDYFTRATMPPVVVADFHLSTLSLAV